MGEEGAGEAMMDIATDFSVKYFYRENNVTKTVPYGGKFDYRRCDVCGVTWSTKYYGYYGGDCLFWWDKEHQAYRIRKSQERFAERKALRIPWNGF